MLPGVPPPAPEMVAVAAPGELIAAPVEGLFSATVKVLVPEKGVTLRIGTVNILVLVSPSAQLRTPVVAA